MIMGSSTIGRHALMAMNFFLERYSSGSRGAPAKGVGRLC